MSRILKVLLLVESSRASGRALLKGVAAYSHQHGPWSFYWEPGGLETAWPKLKSLDLDGIILRDVDKLDEVLALGIPAVVVGHEKMEVPGLVNLVTDSTTIGQLAADHLLACGFRQFAYCGNQATHHELTSWSEHRLRAFSDRIREAGFDCRVYESGASAGVSWQQERRAMVRWIESLPKPIGLMACNDDRARQVVEACKLARVTVPDEVGVMGVDNDEVVCGLSDPPLSSIGVNFERAGHDAAQALDHLMSGGKQAPARILVRATHVLVRRSTDFVASDDVPMAKALRFIRDGARQGSMGVSEVAKAAGMSRRALEKRFRRELGHSILHEIRRVRTDQIACLLVETQLPVGRIAESLGFDNFQHFARYFRSAKRMSPLGYRKTHGIQHLNTGRAQNGESFPRTGVAL